MTHISGTTPLWFRRLMRTFVEPIASRILPPLGLGLVETVHTEDIYDDEENPTFRRLRVTGGPYWSIRRAGWQARDEAAEYKG